MQTVLYLMAALAIAFVAIIVFLLGWGIAAIVRNYIDKAKAVKLKVIHRHNVSDTVFVVRLAKRFGIKPWLPGQYLALHIPIGSGSTIKRAYSIANFSSSPSYYELAITKDGVGSGWLHQHLLPGKTIACTMPSGAFVLNPHQPSLVMVAGGIGITPLKAMIDALVHGHNGSSPVRNVTLFYSTAYLPDLVYHHYFADLQQRFPWFRYHVTITRPSGNDGWTGRTGRFLPAEMLTASPPHQTGYYLCASSGVMDQLVNYFNDNGVPSHHIYYERFGAVPVNGAWFEGNVTVDGQSLLYSGNGNLYYFMERNGIEMNGHCRSGQCGLCSTKLIKGDVAHLIVPEHEPRNGYILPCCTMPASPLELESE